MPGDRIAWCTIDFCHHARDRRGQALQELHGLQHHQRVTGFDAVAERDGETTTVTFSEPGPLAALLGQGDPPVSPLALGPADLAQITENLGALQLGNVIEVDDAIDTSIVTYRIAGAPVPLAQSLLSSTLMMDAEHGSAERADLGQQLRTTAWDVSFVGASNTLRGSIEADITGGSFDFRAIYTYDGLNVYPYTELICP